MSFTSTLTQVSEKPAVLRAYAGRCLGRLVVALALTVFGMSFASSTAWSQVPHDMTYQGQLTDSVGAPLSGPVDLKLRIFDLLSGGSALYAEDHAGVSLDDDGGFSVQLGAGSATSGTFGPSLFSGVNRYLEVVVDTDVLTPRQVLASVPWALVAEEASELQGLPTLAADLAGLAAQDSTLQGSIDAEVSARAVADAAHGAAIAVNTTATSDEAAARVAADAAQDTSLAAEVSARSAGDSALDTRLGAVENSGYSTGAHTTNTDTQLTNSQVRDAALAQGFVMGAHTTDTKLNESQVDAYVANNGYSTGAHTTNTDTQLTNSQVRDAALAQGFVMGAHTTDTKLNESQVDAYVANNGYSTGAHTTNTDTQLTNSQVRDAALAQGFVMGAHTTDTKLNESQVDAFVANNGYSTGAHTTNTNTQLTNSQVRNAAIAEGFVTGSHTTNTTLNEAQVDAYVADNGFASATVASANSAAIAELAAEIDSGDITCTSCSSFFAYRGTNFMILAPTSPYPVPIPFDETDHNVGNDFDSGSGNFIAPATGIYHFSSSVLFTDWSGNENHSARLHLYVNGADGGVLDRVSGNTGTRAFTLNGSVTRSLNASDSVSIRVHQNAGNRFVSGTWTEVGTQDGIPSNFSGFRVH